MLHKAKRPVRSIGAAEILAAFAEIDKEKVTKTAFSMQLECYVGLVIVDNSKDLFTFLSIQRNSIDRSIRADVNIIHLEFETGSADKIIWVPGSVNFVDPNTKRDG